MRPGECQAKCAGSWGKKTTNCGLFLLPAFPVVEPAYHLKVGDVVGQVRRAFGSGYKTGYIGTHRQKHEGPEKGSKTNGAEGGI